MIDYALWEVIKNGNTLPITQVMEGVETVMPLTTVKEKAQRRLEVKARSTLMMGIPNEHQLKFNFIKDAKLLLEAIEKRFGGNEATKKTQRNLLKQHFENFSGSSSEMLDQTFDRLQKLVSQLEILNEKISQEDVNQKLLRSLSLEWHTHVVVWRNKPDLDSIIMDDLYNNLKEMDLKWRMAMLIIRTRRFLKNIGRKLNFNGNESISFDKSKVECFNCHKMGHFARECKASRHQDQNNKESFRMNVPVETTNSSALVSYDGLSGYDWSDQAEEGPNYALMAYSTSSSDSKNTKAKTSDVEPKDARKDNGASVIEYWVSDNEEDSVSQPKVDKKIVKPSVVKKEYGNLQTDLQEQGVIDRECSRNMTKNKSYLTNYEEIDVGYVAFGGNPKGGKITSKVNIKTGNLDFKNVYFVRELKFNLFSVSQICDKKNIVLFTDTECIVLSLDFKLIYENQVLFKVPRKNNMYSVDLKNIVSKEEAVSTACYEQNKVLVVKPHNKTPYELFHGRTPTLSFMRPFECPVIIFNTIDQLGKFDGKANEGFFVGYSLNSKTFRVFNSRTMIVEENLHIRFSKNIPNVVGTQSNGFAGTKASDNASQAKKEKEPVKDYILLPLWTADPPFLQDPKSSQDDGSKPSNEDGKKADKDPRKDSEFKDQEKDDSLNSTNRVNTISSTVNAASSSKVNVVGKNISDELPNDLNMPELEDISIFEDLNKDVGAKADINNLESTFQVSPIPTTRIHKDHPFDQVIRDVQSAIQTKRMLTNLEE
nr:ribonuclease H-like domain-containing protein [Tanacetum cinerariifolium]